MHFQASALCAKFVSIGVLAVGLIEGLEPFGVAAAEREGAIVNSEFIYESAPFPSCHASTIAETPSALVSAWFGGTAEKNPDVGIWLSRHEQGKWTAPIEVANGVESANKRYPTWNPVLFQPK